MDASIPYDVPVLLITGFGPFHSVRVNPSWEVAKALKTYLEWSCPVHIIIEQMNVTYDDVSNKIPDYWLKYNPTVRANLTIIGSTNYLISASYSYWRRSWHPTNSS